MGDGTRSAENSFNFDAPAKKKKYKNIIMSVCIYILVTEMCERLAYYGLSGSLKAFVNKHLGFPNAQAAAIPSALTSVVYITPLLGGYLADVHWGRYKTILVFAVLYVIGTALMAASSYPSLENKSLFLFALFCCVGLGSGGIKANVVTMGGDQFDTNDKEEAKQMDTFFNYFYWMINIGATISYTFIAQVAINGIGGISQNYGFFTSFTICSAALAMAVLSFVSAKSRYTIKPPAGSAFASFLSTLLGACLNSWTGYFVLLGFFLQVMGWAFGLISPFLTEGSEAAKVVSLCGCLCAALGLVLIILTCITPSWVTSSNSASMEEGLLEDNNSTSDTKDFMRVLPTLMFSVTFWIVYNQMAGNFFIQACQMDVRLGDSSQQLNGAVLNVGDCLAIIICIPLLDTFFYPFVERMTGRPFRPLDKMILGYFAAFAAMASASIIEVYRRDAPVLTSTKGSSGDCVFPFEVNGKVFTEGSCTNDIPMVPPAGSASFFSNIRDDDDAYWCVTEGAAQRDGVHILNATNYGECAFVSKCAPNGILMSDISVYWMIIPYFLIGVSECFISVQLYDLCYSEVPATLRSTAQAMNLFMTAMAGAVTGAITVAFAAYVPTNLNNGHIEYNYYLGGGLALLSIPPFLYVREKFVYKKGAGLDQEGGRERTPSTSERRAGSFSGGSFLET